MEQLEQTIEILYKQCNQCGEIKCASEFGKLKSSVDGYRTICKKCIAKNNKSFYSNYKHEDIMKFMEEGVTIPGKFLKVIEYVDFIIGPSGRRVKTKRYNVLCECGRTRCINTTQINRFSSCGLKECTVNVHARRSEDSIIKESVIDGFFIKNSIWTGYISSATDRNIQFDITIEDVLEVWKSQEGRCNKSGHKLSPGDKGDTHTWSINRIDSKKGYVKGNIELTAKFVNILHNKFDEQPVDLYCMKRIVWLMKNNREYIEQLKEICRMDEEDPSVLDNEWKSANKYKKESIMKGISKTPLFKKEEINSLKDSVKESSIDYPELDYTVSII